VGEISLYWLDAAGQEHSLQKLIGEELANLDDGDHGPVSFPMDCYGQGETARLGHRAKSDPLALLKYLDRFVDLQAAHAAEDAARDRLLDLQTKIEEAEQQVALIPRYERDLALTQQQLKASEKANAAEVIRLQRKLADEREIRIRIKEAWEAAQGIVNGGALKQKVDELRTVAVPSEVAVGTNEVQAIVSGAETLAREIATADALLEQQAGTFATIVARELRAWRAKDEDAKRTIEAKRQELEAQGVRLDMTFIQKVAADEAKYKKTLETLSRWKPRLTAVKAERAKVLKERWSARDRVAAIRTAYGKTASETLRASLTDLQVTLKFVPNGCAPEAAEQIQQMMGWRTNQVPRANLITEKLTLPKLLEAIEKKTPAAISALVFDDGTQPFNSQDANEILARLGEPGVKYALERCAVHDLPRLLVTKRIMRGGKEVHVTREFSKLSLGQQQSILLTLLLSSDGSDPLIIDQPEDNLDGEFIYSSFVPVLRRAKERRQIIIVTHNANIAVLGDAEQIVVLKAHGDAGIITARGSIDDASTRKEACNPRRCAGRFSAAGEDLRRAQLMTRDGSPSMPYLTIRLGEPRRRVPAAGQGNGLPRRLPACPRVETV
jgi:DNA repair exonuclease SbcCD ATPase subunit